MNREKYSNGSGVGPCLGRSALKNVSIIRRSSGKSRLAAFGLLAMMLPLAVAPVGPVIGDVGLGHGFYGNVKLDGEDAAVGTVISARIDGTEYGSCTVATPGQYALLVQGDIVEGTTIKFYVDDQQAEQTFDFRDGWTTELDITLTTPTYALTMLAEPEAGGMATDETGESPYPEGASVEIKAEASEGFRFVNWTAPAGGFEDAEEAETTFIMPDEDVIVTANFEAVTTSDLTITSTAGGFVTATVDEEETLIEADEEETISDVPEDTEVDLVATPDDGYRFIEWEATAGEFDGAEQAETTFIMPAVNVTVTANFALVEYTLTIDSTEGGEVTVPGEGAFPYPAGEVVDLVAVADDHYQFVEWTGDIDEIDDPVSSETTLTMPGADVAVTASFQVDPSVPSVTTEAATDITTYSAVVNMSYTMGKFSSVEVRFAAKRATDATWFHGSWVSRTEDGTYAYQLTDLASQTEYEFKAQLRYDDTVIEGDVRRFTTGAEPTLGLGFLPCFIATAAYGTPAAEEIDVLRGFRDVVLLESTVGSQLVALYYRLSPPLADVVAGNGFLRTIVRELLVDPVVWMVRATGEIWRN